MRQYKHLVIFAQDSMPPEMMARLGRDLDHVGRDGYFMVGYHQLDRFTVLVFEHDEAGSQGVDVEYKHFPRPCPYCGRSENISDYFQGLTHYYMCDNTACGARGPLRPTQPAALAAWNGSPSL